MFRRLAQQVHLAAKQGFRVHHHLLAQRVDWRVGYLGKKLLEVVVEELTPLTEDGQGNVAAHARHRLLAVVRHRQQDSQVVFLRVAERPPQGRRLLRRVGGNGAFRSRQVVQPKKVLLDPARIGLFPAYLVLDFVVLKDATGVGIDDDQPARPEPAFESHRLRRDRQYARLASQNKAVVGGNDIATGAQAVAIEHGSDLPAVGEDEAGRAVPRLRQATVILVEGASRRIEPMLAFVGFGYEHHQGVRQAAAVPR